MFGKKKGSRERRKSERRKPGDQRFAGRLVGRKTGKDRKDNDRRKGERRKKSS